MVLIWGQTDAITPLSQGIHLRICSRTVLWLSFRALVTAPSSRSLICSRGSSPRHLAPVDLNPGTSDAAVPYRSALSAQALVLSQSGCVGSRLPESVISAANNPAMISFG